MGTNTRAHTQPCREGVLRTVHDLRGPQHRLAIHRCIALATLHVVMKRNLSQRDKSSSGVASRTRCVRYSACHTSCVTHLVRHRLSSICAQRHPLCRVLESVRGNPPGCTAPFGPPLAASRRRRPARTAPAAPAPRARSRARSRLPTPLRPPTTVGVRRWARPAQRPGGAELAAGVAW
eukprot:SAG11_NODE_5790_length_1462_cov_8.147361_1_plen_178_part_00